MSEASEELAEAWEEKGGVYRYKARVESVYDGDTATLMIDVGFNIYLKEKVRFLGIDTPEIRTRDKEEKRRGKIVRDYVKRRVEGKDVMIDTTKGEGKFGRYLVDVYYEEDGEVRHLNKELVKNGMAKEYFGGAR